MSKAARQRALGLAAETMGELVDFWGFKASTGRIWTLLYLHTKALPADVIAEELNLSTGAVSMGLAELMQWSLVAREPMPEARKRHYRAETDIWGIIRRIVRERELRLVGRSVQAFDTAVKELERAVTEGDDSEETAFMLERLRGLRDLAKMGYSLVENLAELGQFTLKPIQGMLSWGRR